jgi:hypothetical protein
MALGTGGSGFFVGACSVISESSFVLGALAERERTYRSGADPGNSVRGRPRERSA